jgi:hypothetical protein
MPKITNQSGLNTSNLKLNIVELTQRTTISINSATSTISDSANEFISKGFEVGDRIIIRFANPTNPNNGYATIDTVAAGAITISSFSPSNSGAVLTTQAAGASFACTIQRLKKTIQFVATSGLDFVDGVAQIALTSELQTLWDSGDYDSYPFPYTERRPDAETIELVDGWDLHDEDTINALRDGAVIVRNGESNALEREYMNVNSPAFYAGTGQARFWQTAGGTIADFVTQGYINQLVLIRDVPNSIDRRSYFVAKLAEPGRTVVYYNLFIEQPDTGSLTAKKYTLFMNDQLDLVLANADGSVKVSDATISSSAPYTSITYTRHSPVAARTIESNSYDFDAIIARTGATKEEVHTKLNWLVRQQATDIDAGSGTLLGGHSPAISTFIGTSDVTYRGYTDGLPASERNDSTFIDSIGVGRKFARVAAFTLQFLVAPYLTGTAKFAVYLASVFNTDGITSILDSAGAAIEGTITGDTSLSFAVAFETFNQFNHPANTAIPIIVTLSAPGQLLPQEYAFVINNNTTQIFQLRGQETTAFRAAA